MLIKINSRTYLDIRRRWLCIVCLHSRVLRLELALNINTANFELRACLIGRTGKFASHFQFHFLEILLLFLLARHCCL